jgi:hypothetical protein
LTNTGCNERAKESFLEETKRILRSTLIFERLINAGISSAAVIPL